MSQQSPLNVITLPTTVQELQERLETTIEHYESHLPAFFTVEMPDIDINSEPVIAYKEQLTHIFDIIQKTGMPNHKNFSFEEILYDPENLEGFLSCACVLECSLVHALVKGVIDQETFDNEGVQLICSLFIPIMFGADTKATYSLYDPN